MAYCITMKEMGFVFLGSGKHLRIVSWRALALLAVAMCAERFIFSIAAVGQSIPVYPLVDQWSNFTNVDECNARVDIPPPALQEGRSTSINGVAFRHFTQFSPRMQVAEKMGVGPGEPSESITEIESVILPVNQLSIREKKCASHLREIIRLLLDPRGNRRIVIDCRMIAAEMRRRIDAGTPEEVARAFEDCLIGWLKEHGEGLDGPHAVLPGKTHDEKYALDPTAHRLVQLTEKEARKKVLYWNRVLKQPVRPAFEIDRSEFLSVMLALGEKPKHWPSLVNLYNLVSNGVEISYDCRGPRQYLDHPGPLVFPAVSGEAKSDGV
jgi:hypothetical protein